MTDPDQGLRVGFDMISAGRGFALAAGGMPTYYEGLSRGLVELDELESLITFVPPATDALKLPNSPKVEQVVCRGLRGGRPGRVAYEHLRLPGLARRRSAQVLLSTVNVKPLRWRGPSVVVLQSMQSLFPDRIGRARKAYLRAFVPRSLRSADRVIAVSETARDDACELYDLDPERVVAVHHGASPWATEAAARFAKQGTPPVPPPLDPLRPYVVMVSSLYAHKNHARLIEAFALAARKSGLPHDLVIAGAEADVTVADLVEVARRAGIADRVRLLGAYPQEHLPALIANADAMAYPSLYETFGHPVLEAFAFARPLLTSNAGGASEVAADAAVKVDPASVESISSGLADLLTDRSLRESLVAEGTKRLRDFSWDRCARGTARTLREAIESHRPRNDDTT
jgi:glycosyltransferase involved in cell wall biosynthesis